MITVQQLREKYPGIIVPLLAKLPDEVWNKLDEAMFNEDWKTVDEISGGVK